jgi:arginyl-tRNA synthetase
MHDITQVSFKDRISKIVAKAAGVEVEKILLEHPDQEIHGDYSTNIALLMKGGREMADKIASAIKPDEVIAKVEVAGPGFVNVFIRSDYLVNQLAEVLTQGQGFGNNLALNGTRVMVEYAHPNTHKEMHIGHMRTLITGEAVARIQEAVGAKVFRANYQGDIGPHVAKAIWGTMQLLNKEGLTWEDAENWPVEKRAHLLGMGYVTGNQQYEENAKEIEVMNTNMYQKSADIWKIYTRTRRWSIEYYETFYRRFGMKFDKLFFESEVADAGKKLVESMTGKFFEKSQGAIIFDGEKYNLHKRVFVTAEGNPTYEGKEMALAFIQYKTFPFDKNIHVVANEQTEYFRVVFKALEIIDPEMAKREYHLAMGMVTLVGRKMSSRTGEIITVDGLLDEVKEEAEKLIHSEVPDAEKGKIAEGVTLAAVKYSTLKIHPTLNAVFDLKQSVSLEGNSGPYLQYTYARIRSVQSKSGRVGERGSRSTEVLGGYKPNSEEMAVLRWIYRFPEVVEEAALKYSPNLVCNFLFELAQRFNTFYNKHSILTPEENSKGEGRNFRLGLTAATGQVLKNGLGLLGIEVLDRM